MCWLKVASKANVPTLENLRATLTHSILASTLATNNLVSFYVALAEFAFALLLLFLMLGTGHPNMIRINFAAPAKIN
jgi:hypothetical protein